MPLYNETRQGQSPKVSAAGGGSLVVDWSQEPNGFQRSSQVLSTILSTIEQEDTKKQKKIQDKFDSYKVLREAGYDTKAAFEAIQSGIIPSTAPSETTKEQKDKLELQQAQENIKKTKADTSLSEQKSAAYARGDFAKKQSAADKMNAAQLQREIKRVSDPFENPDYDSEEAKSYLSYLNQKLQQISQYPGTQPPAEEPTQLAPVEAAKPPVLQASPTGKIRVRRKSDGQLGLVSSNKFDPKKYDKA